MSIAYGGDFLQPVKICFDFVAMGVVNCMMYNQARVSEWILQLQNKQFVLNFGIASVLHLDTCQKKSLYKKTVMAIYIRGIRVQNTSEAIRGKSQGPNDR